jgi:hypothetical protein
MGKKPTPPKFERRNETDLLRVATEALPADFPNPERLSCPEASTLQAIAGRRLSLPDVDDVVDHIATCSPCFTAYSAYRREHRSRSYRRRTAAAVIVLTVVISSWYLARKALSPTQRSPQQISEVTPLTAVLDFRNSTAERSDQTPLPRPQEAPHLRRSLLNLQIQLPLGTEDGSYALQFRNNAGGIAAESIGTAKWDGTTETLSARIDLRTVEPGQYTLAVRRGAASWRQYSVFVD